MFNHAFADMLDDDTSFRCVASVENIRELGRVSEVAGCGL